MTNTVKDKRPNIIDSFTLGAKNGLMVGLNSMLPGLVFAYLVMQIIQLTGLTQVIEFIFDPIMQIIGLPGAAITPLIISLMTTSGGLGAAVQLVVSGQMSPEQLTMIFPSLMIQGAMLQYLGRVLSIAQVKTRYYPLMICVVIFNSVIAMIIMAFILKLKQ